MDEEIDTCGEDEGAEGAGDAFAGWGEALQGDGEGDEGHDAEVHGAKDEEENGVAGAAQFAMQAEAQAVPPGGAGVG